MKMSSKKEQKKNVEKSLNTLVLIIALLSFAVIGSLVYESKINNQITGQVTGLEGGEWV